MSRELTLEEQQTLQEMMSRARKAQAILENYDQEAIDDLCRAVAWEISNKRTFSRLVILGVEESRMGDPVTRMNKRMKIWGILRDALRQKSVGIIEEIPEKGIVKYAKPVGVIASLVPTTNPELTPGGQAVYAIKARDAIIFAPHPRAKKTTWESVEVMRNALRREGAPEDLLQCIPNPSLPLSQALMAAADLTIATGSLPMVKAAYSSGKPAYASGAGNATVIFDETADVKQACLNTMLSKTSDFGSGCSADGNLIVHESIYEQVKVELQAVGGYWANEKERDLLKAVIWDENGKRLPETVAVSPQQLAKTAGFTVPEDAKFIWVEGDGIGPEYPLCHEKLTTLLSLYKYEGSFDNAIKMALAILDVGGKGHSVGIFSYNNDHIHSLAMVAPVSRIMVRQPQSRSNAGSPTNGMPMTSSLGCGTWGNNIVSENISLKHYMNTTWVSFPIERDMPSPEELFGRFYDPKLDEE